MNMLMPVVAMLEMPSLRLDVPNPSFALRVLIQFGTTAAEAVGGVVIEIGSSLLPGVQP